MLPDLRLESLDNRTQVSLVARSAADPLEQHILLRDSLPRASTTMLFVPSDADGFAGYAVIMALDGSVSPADVAAVQQAAKANANRATPPGEHERQWRLAMASVGEHNRRSALLAVAQMLALPRCIDVFLTADERWLIDISAAGALSGCADPLAAAGSERRSSQHRVAVAATGSDLRPAGRRTGSGLPAPTCAGVTTFVPCAPVAEYRVEPFPQPFLSGPY